MSTILGVTSTKDGHGKLNIVITITEILFARVTEALLDILMVSIPLYSKRSKLMKEVVETLPIKTKVEKDVSLNLIVTSIKRFFFSMLATKLYGIGFVLPVFAL